MNGHRYRRRRKFVGYLVGNIVNLKIYQWLDWNI